ncbi:hypothetical protein CVT24_007545, partial [Panaeolus cyanescens]
MSDPPATPHPKLSSPDFLNKKYIEALELGGKARQTPLKPVVTVTRDNTDELRSRVLEHRTNFCLNKLPRCQMTGNMYTDQAKFGCIEMAHFVSVDSFDKMNEETRNRWEYVFGFDDGRMDINTRVNIIMLEKTQHKRLDCCHYLPIIQERELGFLEKLLKHNTSSASEPETETRAHAAYTLDTVIPVNGFNYDMFEYKAEPWQEQSLTYGETTDTNGKCRPTGPPTVRTSDYAPLSIFPLAHGGITSPAFVLMYFYIQFYENNSWEKISRRLKAYEELKTRIRRMVGLCDLIAGCTLPEEKGKWKPSNAPKNKFYNYRKHRGKAISHPDIYFADFIKKGIRVPPQIKMHKQSLEEYKDDISLDPKELHLDVRMDNSGGCIDTENVEHLEVIDEEVDETVNTKDNGATVSFGEASSGQTPQALQTPVVQNQPDLFGRGEKENVEQNKGTPDPASTINWLKPLKPITWASHRQKGRAGSGPMMDNNPTTSPTSEVRSRYEPGSTGSPSRQKKIVHSVGLNLMSQAEKKGDGEHALEQIQSSTKNNSSAGGTDADNEEDDENNDEKEDIDTDMSDAGHQHVPNNNSHAPEIELHSERGLECAPILDTPATPHPELSLQDFSKKEDLENLKLSDKTQQTPLKLVINVTRDNTDELRSRVLAHCTNLFLDVPRCQMTGNMYTDKDSRGCIEMAHFVSVDSFDKMNKETRNRWEYVFGFDHGRMNINTRVNIIMLEATQHGRLDRGFYLPIIYERELGFLETALLTNVSETLAQGTTTRVHVPYTLDMIIPFHGFIYDTFEYKAEKWQPYSITYGKTTDQNGMYRPTGPPSVQVSAHAPLAVFPFACGGILSPAFVLMYFYIEFYKDRDQLELIKGRLTCPKLTDRINKMIFLCDHIKNCVIPPDPSSWKPSNAPHDMYYDYTKHRGKAIYHPEIYFADLIKEGRPF